MANNPIQPVLNNAACEMVIQGTYVGTLVMCDDNIPYAVPMNHAFVDGKLYFHCAVRGRKIDMIKQNPNVTYVISKNAGTADTSGAGKPCHGPWESLIAYGTARVVEDLDEKSSAFRTFMEYYGTSDFRMNDQARTQTSAIVIDVTSMTVRSEITRGQTEYWLWLPHEGSTSVPTPDP
jgi:nitroimidazol reductase NimA-like FMN-containing flavoprotein (pyridoxamine 5'-phosphate oxidase superfamily)